MQLRLFFQYGGDTYVTPGAYALASREELKRRVRSENLAAKGWLYCWIGMADEAVNYPVMPLPRKAVRVLARRTA